MHVESPGSPPRLLLLLASPAMLFAVAINLRPGVTSVGPVLPSIGRDLSMGVDSLGLLGTVPLLCFGLGSAAVPLLSRRLGADRVMLAALLILASGIVTRSYGGSWGIWTGSVLVGLAIAAGNVLLPALVRRSYVGRIGRATGLSSALMMTSASIASAVAVPLAVWTSWRSSMAVWALPAALVALAWAPRAVRSPPAPAVDRRRRGPSGDAPSRSTTVWVTLFMGLQSTAFYVMVTWLPTIETSHGVDERTAGYHLFVFQAAGILAGLATPFVLGGSHDQRNGTLGSTLLVVIGTTGLLVAPGALIIWITAVGAGTGSSIVVALTLISLRGRNPAATTRLSGTAQTWGYLIAAAGPVSVGAVAEKAATWDAGLLLLLGFGLVQLAVALPAGRSRPASSPDAPHPPDDAYARRAPARR